MDALVTPFDTSSSTTPPKSRPRPGLGLFRARMRSGDDGACAPGLTIGLACGNQVDYPLPDQSFAPMSVKRNPAGVLVKTKYSSPQTTE